ncbi:serine-rich adhesin for platelets isoform X5 [Anopheles darlingi]|uniref:serine-rich adhesin for platelets isoform X5 n=1 Tax=Anopheles darlingi TaxID=43151 RepID=UPI0021004E75|nr:serine-rich adhesin for platelets isoform X5 [Anopheles darlingi]
MRPIISAPTAVAQSPSSSRITQLPSTAEAAPAPSSATVAPSAAAAAPNGTTTTSTNSCTPPTQSVVSSPDILPTTTTTTTSVAAPERRQDGGDKLQNNNKNPTQTNSTPATTTTTTAATSIIVGKTASPREDESGMTKKSKKMTSSSAAAVPPTKPPIAPSKSSSSVGGKLSWKSFLPNGGKATANGVTGSGKATAAKETTPQSNNNSNHSNGSGIDANNNEMGPRKTSAATITLVNDGSSSDPSGNAAKMDGKLTNGSGTNGIGETMERNGNGLGPVDAKTSTGPTGKTNGQLPPLPPATAVTTNGVSVRKDSIVNGSDKATKAQEETNGGKPPVDLGKSTSGTAVVKSVLSRSLSGNRLTANGKLDGTGAGVTTNGAPPQDTKDKKKSSYILGAGCTDGGGGTQKSGSTATMTGAPIGVRLSLKPSSRRSVTPDRSVDPKLIKQNGSSRASPVRTPSVPPPLLDTTAQKEKNEKSTTEGGTTKEKSPASSLLRTSSSKSIVVVPRGDGSEPAKVAETSETSSSKPVVKVRRVIRKIIKKKPKAGGGELESSPSSSSVAAPVDGTPDAEKQPTIAATEPLMGAVETTITHETTDGAMVRGIVEISKMQPELAKSSVSKKSKEQKSSATSKVKEEKQQKKQKNSKEKEENADYPTATATPTPLENGAESNGATSGETTVAERKHWAIRKRLMADRAMSCGPLEGDRSSLPGMPTADLLESFLLSLATLPQEIAVDLPEMGPVPKYGANRSLARSASQYLSTKIQDFLRRTDHVMQDWRNLGRSMRRREDFGIGSLGDVTGLGMGTVRSRSVSNIITRGLQLLKKDQSPRRGTLTSSIGRNRGTGSTSVSRSSSRSSFYCELPTVAGGVKRSSSRRVRRRLEGGADDDDDCSTVVDMSEELSDVTSELTEEHSSSNLITERLASETSERLRLEKEVKEYESKYRNLQESSEKMEMELLCAKSELNYDFDDCSTFGGSEYDAGDIGSEDAGDVVKNYRQRYERVARELEFTKKRLQTQHEHDLEQLVGLKKQLEKKLADAYEQVEEQRNVVAQWKRKAQKMTNEMNDLRLLYEEQSSRNNVLEKRQRKFDAECQTFQDSARQERQAKERLAREKDVLVAEKCKLEQDLSDVRLELELKEEKNAALQTELDEMMFGGGTEEEIAQLKRQKLELDRRCKEQDEELDEMAGQIQLLEQAKLRLEMSLETTRKEARKEAQQRDDEMEEIRGASYKKVKSLECQLEQEHEERTLLLREKHELERRLSSLEDQDRAERAAEEAMVQKLKRDNRKYRALLRDAQSQLERAKGDSAGKALVRQLRNQLEDAESARAVAVKARQTLEVELQDAQMLIDETARARNEAEDKASVALRDRTELQGQLDENEEELAELMKKYSATVKQLSSEQALIAEYELRLSELEGEKRSLKEQVVELAARLENVETIGDSSNSMQFKRLELRTKEVESRLEFEQATRARIEIQLNRHKDSLEKMQGDLSQARAREAQAQDAVKKTQKTIRELREELSALGNRDQEHMTKRKELEKRIETAESETASARADLRLALQRIADLQQAMEEEGDSYHSDSDASDSSSSMDSFHESTVTRKSSSVGSGVGGSLDPFGATNGSRGNGSLVGGTRDGRKESNNPRIRPSLIGSVRRKKRLHPTIKEEDEGFETDELATGKSSPSGSDRRSSTLSPTEDKERHQLDADQLSPDREVQLEAAQANRPPSFTVTSFSTPDEQRTVQADSSATVSEVDGACNDQSDFPFDINTLKSIKEKIHSLNQIIRDESHESGTSEIDLVDLKNLKNQIHEFKKAIECSRSRSMDKLASNGGGLALIAPVPAPVITTSASTGSATTSTNPDAASSNGV